MNKQLVNEFLQHISAIEKYVKDNIEEVVQYSIAATNILGTTELCAGNKLIYVEEGINISIRLNHNCSILFKISRKGEILYSLLSTKFHIISLNALKDKYLVTDK